jgi:hypothetical protein
MRVRAVLAGEEVVALGGAQLTGDRGAERSQRRHLDPLREQLTMDRCGIPAPAHQQLERLLGQRPCLGVSRPTIYRHLTRSTESRRPAGLA